MEKGTRQRSILNLLLVFVLTVGAARSFVSHASPGGDELLVFHPSATVGLTEMYGSGLLCNSRRLLTAWTLGSGQQRCNHQPKLPPARSTQWGQVDDGRLCPNYELEELWPAPWLDGRLQWTVRTCDSFSELMTQPL